jgi:tRNA dimethylallyltransferase
MSNDRHLVVIAGPTAVGKTKVSIQLAQHFETTIVSCDSRQFYREMNIGTAKPTTEELATVPHHFINVLSIHDPLFSASDFEQQALERVQALFTKHRVVLLTGGSGMYINALCNGLDEQLPPSNPIIRAQLKENYDNKGIAFLQLKLKELDPVFFEQIDQHNHQRLIRAIEVCLITGKRYSDIRTGKRKKRPFNIIKIALNQDRKQLYERINNRVDEMIRDGLEKEASGLQPFMDTNPLKTVGYQEMYPYLLGNCSKDEAVEKIKVNTRRYAKRQLSWFKKDPEYIWFEPDQLSELIQFIEGNTKQ